MRDSLIFTLILQKDVTDLDVFVVSPAERD